MAASALAGAAHAAPAPERYRLGVMASMYGSVPLDDAMARIRKAGYHYICPGNRHGSEVVFAPSLPKAERALAADATGTIIGGMLGTSTVTSYIESIAGVQAGARTGLGSTAGGVECSSGAAAGSGGAGGPCAFSAWPRRPGRRRNNPGRAG